MLLRSESNLKPQTTLFELLHPHRKVAVLSAAERGYGGPRGSSGYWGFWGVLGGPLWILWILGVLGVLGVLGQEVAKHFKMTL
ncbi:hypothetical protein EYF80_044830 [Liparis tanakae]|uniref:Uncharacterized protein n=1 Tax=Liparis tanakae TaxID=230148 RepID=A0A4Z2FUU4_9TELE|nr:hypothetical protein EYF80_044830 [Liparis tanakae]